MSDEVVKNFIEMTVRIHRDFLQAATIDIKSDIDWLLDQEWFQQKLSTVSTSRHKNKESERELPNDYEPSRVTKLWLDFSNGELGRTYFQLYEEALNFSRKHCQLLVANLRMIKQQIELLPNAARSAAIARRTIPLIILEAGESTKTSVAKVDDEHLTETLAELKSDFAAIAPNDVSPGKTLWQVPPHVTWSPNYEWLKIGNDDYSFNRSQRSCMEVMLEQYEQNGVTQFDGNITLAMAEIEKGTLLEIFKRSKLKADGRIQPSKTRKGWVQIIFDKI